MNKIVCFVLLVLMIPSALAAEKQVYDSWHYYQDEFVFDGSVYTVRLVRDDINKLRLQKDGETMILDYDPEGNDCVTKDNYKYCYKEYSYDLNCCKSTFDNYERQVPGVRIIIKDLYSNEKITVTKSLTPAKLHIGEEGLVKVEVKNEGELTAYGMQLTEKLPDGLKFVNSNGGLTRIGNELWYAQNLPPGKSINYEYEIMMESFEGLTIPTEISYSYDQENTLTMTKELSVPITGFSATYKFDKNNINVGEVVPYKIILKNEDATSNDMNVKELKINFPLILEVIPISKEITPLGFNDFIITDDELRKERTNEYWFNIRTPHVGSYDAYAELTIEYDDITLYNNHTETLTVGNNDFISSSLDISPKLLRGGNDIIMSGTIKNVADSALYEINGSISSEVYNEEFYLESLAPGEEYQVNTHKNIRMPRNQEEKKVTFLINGTFKSSNGDHGTFETAQEVIVKPATESVSINREFDKLEMSKGESNIVRVTVSNQLGDAITDLVVKDTFSRPVNIISGSTEEKINLQGKGSKLSSAQAYIYNFEIPNNFPDTILEVITEVSSEQKGYREVFVTPITINLSEDVNAEIEEETDNTKNNENNNSSSGTDETDKEQKTQDADTNNDDTEQNNEFFQRIIQQARLSNNTPENIVLVTNNPYINALPHRDLLIYGNASVLGRNHSFPLIPARQYGFRFYGIPSMKWFF